MRFHRREARGERQRTQETRALDLETGLGADAARELEARLEIAVAAWPKDDDVVHCTSMNSHLRRIIASYCAMRVTVGPTRPL